jgi:hypothetical protein
MNTAAPTLVYDIRQSRYLNITGRCTLACSFCPKNNGSKQLHQYQLALDHQPQATEIIPLLGAVDLCCMNFIQQYIGSHIIENASDTILV